MSTMTFVWVVIGILHLLGAIFMQFLLMIEDECFEWAQVRFSALWSFHVFITIPITLVYGWCRDKV